MKEERTDHPPDPRPTETFSHKWSHNCPLDRKQGLGEWTKRDGLCRLKRSAPGSRQEEWARRRQAPGRAQRLVERWARRPAPLVKELNFAKKQTSLS